MEKSKTYRGVFSTYGGVVMAASYGLAVRLLADDVEFSMDITFFSIVFIAGLPLAIGCIPMLVASEKQLASWTYKAGNPALSVFVLMMISIWTRWQDLWWALTISAPFVVVAAAFGLITGYVVRRVRKTSVHNR
jgi:hypothetical protein